MSNSEYVLVPREPTREMLVAAFEQANDQLLRSNKHCKTDEERSAFAVSALYRAMLAAAPAITTWHRIDDPVNPAPKGRAVQLWKPSTQEQYVAALVHGAHGQGWCTQDGFEIFGPTHWKPLDLPPPPDEGG